MQISIQRGNLAEGNYGFINLYYDYPILSRFGDLALISIMCCIIGFGSEAI